MNEEPRIQNREQILGILHFALRHKAFIKWKRNDEAESWIAAERILHYLELSNVRMRMGSPRPGHSTPGDGRQCSSGPPFSPRLLHFNIVRAARN